jgi:hypothetical protein
MASLSALVKVNLDSNRPGFEISIIVQAIFSSSKLWIRQELILRVCTLVNEAQPRSSADLLSVD